MIEENYVSFDTAKLLKEAGFDVECDWFYINDGSVDTGIVIRSTSSRDHNMGTGFLSRPTLALAARWLREVHHYAVCVWYSAEHEKWFYAHGNLDNMMFDEEYSISDFIYDSYEEALEAGLKRGLELVKK